MKNYVKFISSLILFGSNGVVAAKILLPSQIIVVLRTLIGTVFLGCAFVLQKDKIRQPDMREWGCVIASGVSMGASWIFLYEAYQTVGVAVSSLAYYCAPIIVMMLTPILFKEKLTFRMTASFVVVVVGALLINFQTIDTGGSSWGLTCGWLSALCHASMVIFSKMADKVDGLLSSLVQLATSCAVSSAFAVTLGSLPSEIPASSWAWITVLGVVNTGVGCYLYFSSFGGLAAQEVALLGYIEPLSAVACALIFLGEPMSAAQILGGVLIAMGALVGGTKRT